MPLSFGDYLRGFAQRTAEILPGIVKAAVAGGDYTITLEHTGADVTASYGLAASVALPIGRKVLLSRVDASGRGLGNGYVIIALGPIISRNTNATTRLVTSNDRTSEVATAIASGGVVGVSSIQLTHGGAAVVVTVYGFNLLSSAVYGDSRIVDSVAQVVTATLITLSIQAQNACPKGTYSLTVAGQAIPNFLVVI